MAQAVDLQLIVTALAWHRASGRIRHNNIPDDPSTESERRQIFFASAIGLPTFFVRADTKNILLRRILAGTKEQRHSRRKEYRVGVEAWKRACLAVLQAEQTDFFATGTVKKNMLRQTLILSPLPITGRSGNRPHQKNAAPLLVLDGTELDGSDEKGVYYHDQCSDRKKENCHEHENNSIQ